MLDKIRQGIGSFLIKVFLGLIIVSFAVWGIGDIFRSGGESSVASVGDSTISLNTFASEFRRTLTRLQNSLGPEFDQAQARALGYDKLVLDNLVNREMFTQEIERLGILVSDERIGREILSDPNFQDEFGTFNDFYFERLLQINGYTEAAYISEEKVRTAGNQIRSAISNGQMIPEAMARELYRYRQQTRVADLIIVPHASITVPQAATLDQLREYYQAHLSEFTTPEQRSFRYISLTSQAFQDEVSILDEDLRDEYDFSIARYTTEPTRDFMQLVFNSFDEADAAYQDLQAGEDFLFIAQERLQLAAEDVTFANVSASGLPDAIREPVLELAVGELSEPLETDFGWYLVSVTGATEGSIESFESVREELASAMTADRAAELMINTANSVDDALASGAALSTIASDYGLDMQEVGPITSLGFGRSSSSEIIERLNMMVPAVFDSYEGAEPELILTDQDDYYMIEVVRVDAPAVLPFEEVTLQATAGWRVQRRMDLATEKAEDITKRLRSGSSFSDIGASENVDLRVSAPLNRNGATGDNGVGPGLRSALFGAEVGEVQTGLSLDGGGQVVAQLRRIDAPNMTATGQTDADDAYERWRVSLDNAWQADMLNAYELSLNQDFSVSLYPNVLNLAFETPTF